MTLAISRVEGKVKGKVKMNQNPSEADRQGANGLDASPD